MVSILYVQLTLNGFNSLESLSNSICRPCGEQRDGINIGGGRLILLAKAPAPVMLLSSGESNGCMAHFCTTPRRAESAKAMQQALDRAGLKACDIGYLNLHGTATAK